MKPDAPSATALLVARRIAYIAATPDLSVLVPKDAALLTRQLLVFYDPSYRGWLNRIHGSWYRALCRVHERVTIPGLALHLALRKQFLEKTARTALGQGFTQMVVLGAGLDTLALRLHREHPHVNFLELDHPATQAPKAQWLSAEGRAGPNLHLAAEDFSKRPLSEFLAACHHFHADRRTLFIGEGLLMYLREQDVIGLLQTLRELPCPAVRFAFSFMEPGPGGRPGFKNSTWLVRRWLKWQHEVHRWGLPREEMADFLSVRGFELKELATAEAFRAADLAGLLRGRTLAEGELVGVADRW